MNCQRCKGSLGEEHYLQPMAKGTPRMVCVACYDKLVAPPRFTTFQALLRTFAFSAVAALVCGFLAALPIALLTWNSAIVWIFLGGAMGAAVVRASEDRGNWYYRLIGLGSTWCAIGLSWLFCFAIWLAVGPPKESPKDKGPISKSALVSLLKPGKAPTPTPEVSATPSVSATPGAGQPDQPEKPPSPTTMALVAVLFSLLVIVGAPLVVAYASPVSILIYLFALHTTWKSCARESRDLEKVAPLTESEKTDWSRPDGEG
ncbi:MAG: hypothetical protein KF760_26185 [Candidatus Eremiobacteraeota bacterium]|nr:hypothetical protein [Candidatus Eremiobacteraeota bacterium]MCW5869562.1 hypothetical protein [Candidatus Eremiobacteraeota bacterium]